VSSVCSLVLMFAIMVRIDAALAFLSLAVVPFMVLVFRRYAGPMLERGYQQQEVEGRLYDLVSKRFRAIPVVQAFEREEDADRRFRATGLSAIDAALATTTVELRFKILIGLVTALGTAAIPGWSAARPAGAAEPGSLLVFLAYLGSLYVPLNALAYTGSIIQGAGGQRPARAGGLSAGSGGSGPAGGQGAAAVRVRDTCGWRT